METKSLNTTDVLMPLMQRYLPVFRQFLRKELGPGTGSYSYIVPVETKGAVLFDHCYRHEEELFAPTINYLRAFDFMPNEGLRQKRCAVVDDTLYSGRTLRQVKERLVGRGLQVDTFALAIDNKTSDGTDRDEEIRRSTKWAVSLDTVTTYSQYHAELKHWYACVKIPAAFDHLVFKVRNANRLVIRDLLRYLDNASTLLSYSNRGGYDAWASLIDPHHAQPWLAEYSDLETSVPPKIRLWYSSSNSELLLVPMWYPTAPWKQGIHVSEEIRFNSITPDEPTQQQDLLDSLSLIGRARIAGALFRKFPGLLDECSIDMRQLSRLYTESLAQHIEEGVWRIIHGSASVGPPPPSSESKGHTLKGCAVPYRALAKIIVGQTKLAYEQQVSPRYLREPAGYTLSDHLKSYPGHEVEVHAAVDHLIDYGYLATFFGKTKGGQVTRALRATELDADPSLIENLVATYIELASDKHVTSTEVTKLIPLFKHCFGRSFQGYAVRAGLGGLTSTVQLFDLSEQEDVLDVVKRSRLLRQVKEGTDQGFAIDESNFTRDKLLSDPGVRDAYGELESIVLFVHNCSHSLTPSQRATLVSSITTPYCGLDLLHKDAEIMAAQFRNAVKKLREDGQCVLGSSTPDIAPFVKSLGQARALGLEKIALFYRAIEAKVEFIRLTPESRLFQQRFLESIRPPSRWGTLLELWSWFLNGFYVSSKVHIAAMEKLISERDVSDCLKTIWTLGVSPLSLPQQEALLAAGAAWRNALTGVNRIRGAEELAQEQPDGSAFYAHYDLAGSSKQKTNREEWFDYFANIVRNWSEVFGCKSSSRRETQAESGFIWNQSAMPVVDNAVLCTYALYALSEIRRPEQEWIPVFCVCKDDAVGTAIGNKMAASAKITKGITRSRAEEVAQKIRGYKVDSLDNRVFLLGEDVIKEFALSHPGMYSERSDYARELKVELPLCTIDVEKYLAAQGRILRAGIDSVSVLA